MRRTKENKGITLVALVITIIILLILAGITIAQLGENGLFNKTKTSKEKYSFAEAQEQLELDIANLKIEEYLKSSEDTTALDSLKTYLESPKFNGDYIVELFYEPLAATEPTSTVPVYAKVTHVPTKFVFYVDGKLIVIGGESKKNTQEEDNSQKVTTITLDKEVVELQVGGQLQLSANILPGDATNKNLEWISSNPNVASVSNNGLITAVTNGETIITAKSKDGSNIVSSNSCKVKVRLAPEISKIGRVYTTDTNSGGAYINVLGTNINHYTASSNTMDISSYISVKYNSVACEWEISTLNPKLYYSTADNVNDISQLTPFVELKWSYTEIKDYYIYIDQTCTTEFFLVSEKNNIEFTKGDTYQIPYKILPKTLTSVDLEWQSSNENIVTVNSTGLMTGIEVGETTIKAITRGETLATINIKINNRKLIGRVYTTSTSSSGAYIDVLGTSIKHTSAANTNLNISSYLRVRYNTSACAWELTPLVDNLYYSTSNDVSDLSKWQKFTSETWSYDVSRSWYFMKFVE